MQFTPITEAELPKRSRGNTASGDLLNGFVDANIELAKVELEDGAKVPSVRSTLTNYIKAHGLPVKVTTVGTEVFLKRVTPEEAAAEAEAPKRTRKAKNADAEAPAEG